MKNIKAKKTKLVNSETMIAAVDISENINTAGMRVPNKWESKVFEFGNNAKGFSTFWGNLCEAKDKTGCKDIMVAFESTGPYDEPFTHFLKDKPVRVVQANPMHVSRLRELKDNSPGKTDKKDLGVIADVIQLGDYLSVVVPEGIYADLRNLTHARERHIITLTALYNKLYSLVFMIFPEFTKAIKGIRGKVARYLLKNYTTPTEIIKEDIDKLTDVVKEVSRGRMKTEKILFLRSYAEVSVGIKEGKESIVKEIRQILDEIELIKNFVADIEKDMEKKIEEIPYSKKLLKIKGIGIVTLAGIIGEIGDFSKFKTVGEIMKYAGINLYERKSGKYVGQVHISKRGRTLLRKLLFFAGLNVSREGGILHNEYQSYVNRNMKKGKAIMVITRKLLRIIFAMVRDDKEFGETKKAA